MDKNRVAEFILACALPVDRAAAVVGDFSEEAESKGPRWFWASVMRTAFAGLASSFTERPFAMSWTGLIGCLLGWLGPLLAGGALVELRLHHVLNSDLADAVLGLFQMVWLVFYGRLLVVARPGSGIAPAVAVGLMGWFWIAVLILGSAPRPHWGIAGYILKDVLLLAGAALERNHDVRQWRAAHGS